MFANCAAVENKLAELYRNEGPAILDELERVEGWLRYACPQSRLETNVLIGALRLGIPQALLSGERRDGQTNKLVDELAMTEDAAAWAVETWRKVVVPGAAAPMEIQATPQFRSATVPLLPDPESVRDKPLPFDDGTPSVERSAGWFAKEQRLLALLEEVEKGHIRHSGAWVAAVVCIIGVVIAGFSIVLPGQQSHLAWVLIPLGVVVLACGYYYWPDYPKGARRFDRAVMALLNEFPNEMREWGDTAAMHDNEAVISILRAQRERLKRARTTLAIGVRQPPQQATSVQTAPPQRALPQPAPAQASVLVRAGSQIKSVHRGQLILVLGIAGIVLPVLAPFAWGLGNVDLREMAEGRMDRSGESMTTSGRTLGMILTWLYGILLAGVLMSRA